MIRRLHHVGMAVSDLDASVALYRDGLGMSVGDRGRSEREAMDWVLLHSEEAEVELMHSGDAASPVGKFLASRGEGLHHVAYEVADVRAAVERLRERGFELAGEVRPGIHGTPVAFLHPRSVAGVLTELVEAAQE